MNFSQINLDLQSTMKKIYASLLYRSSSLMFANRRYMEAARTETPIIEVVKALPTAINKRQGIELANASGVATPVNPTLATYDSVKVDLTELQKEIDERDYNDSHREIAPLKPADDSVTVNTTGYTLEESINLIIETIKEKM